MKCFKLAPLGISLLRSTAFVFLLILSGCAAEENPSQEDPDSNQSPLEAATNSITFSNPTASFSVSAQQRGTEILPCKTPIVFSFQANVTQKNLSSLQGTIRATRPSSSKRPALQTYVVETKVQFLNKKNQVVQERVSGKQIPDTLQNQPLNLTAQVDWDGLIRGTDLVSVALPGAYQARLTASLVRLTVQERDVIREEILQAGEGSTTLNLANGGEQCQQWAGLLRSLGKSSDHRMKVHGVNTGIEPWISWKKNRPAFIFGNMGQTGSGNYLNVVRTFIQNHPSLFSPVTAANYAHNLNRLRVISTHSDPNGMTRVLLNQSIDEQRANPQTGLSQTVTIPMVHSRITAVFDNTGEMDLLSGRFLEDLPVSFPAASQSEFQARSVVGTHLVSVNLKPAGEALDVGRVVGAGEEIIFGSKPSEYQRAYRVKVGEGRETDLPEKRYDTFEYFVSAVNGALLSIKKTSAEDFTAMADVLAYDPHTLTSPSAAQIEADRNFDPYDYSLLPSDYPSSYDFDPPIVVPGGVRITHNAPDPIFLIDSNHPTSVIEWALLDPADACGISDPVAASAGNCPGTLPTWQSNAYLGANSDAERRALTSFYQIRYFWDQIAAPLLPAGSWDLVRVIVDKDLGDTVVGLYNANNDGKIRISPRFDDRHPRSKKLYAPTHEIFHHFDHEVIDVTSEVSLPIASPIPPDFHPMPGAIKEGTAKFFEQAMSPFPPNTDMGVGTGSLICLWSFSNFWSCMEPWQGIYRSTAIILTPPFRPLRLGETNLSNWPDCRIAEGRHPLCFWASRPGNGGNFDLNATAPTFKHTYQFMAQLLQDLWETGSTVSESVGFGGENFKNSFPMVVARSFTLFDNQTPSFTDFNDALKAAFFLNMDPNTVLPVTIGAPIYAAIDDVFARHGIDADLAQYCVEEDAAGRNTCH